MVEQRPEHAVPLANQLPPLHLSLDLRPRRALPRPQPSFPADRRAQIRHPGRRSRHNGLLVRCLSCHGCLSVRAGLLPGHRVWSCAGRGRVWRF
jgi:hypothetical protein